MGRFSLISYLVFRTSSRKKARQLSLPPIFLLLTEGLAVGALVHGRIGFVSAHQNAVQRAEVLVLAVVCALLDGALDALVGMIVHTKYLLLSKLGVSMRRKEGDNLGKNRNQSNRPEERYRLPESGSRTTKVFPRFSGIFAVSRAA